MVMMKALSFMYSTPDVPVRYRHLLAMTSVSYKKAEANEEVPYDAEPTLNNFILEVV